MVWSKKAAAFIVGASSMVMPTTAAFAATVDYNLNGPAGIVHTEKSSGDVTVEEIGVSFDGLGTLTGWNTKVDGTGTTYNVGDKVSADTTLYAQYSDHTMLASGLTVKDGKTYYYVDGNKKTGIINVGGQLMYFDPSADGVLVTSKWFSAGNKTYYADGNGVLKANQITEIDGKTYVFAVDGALATGFVSMNGKTYSASGSGESGKHDGWVVSNTWVTLGKGKAYATGDGSLATGIVSINGMSHMFGSDGVAVAAGWHETGLSDANKAWCETTGDMGLIVTWSTQNDSAMTTFAGWDINEETRNRLLKMSKSARDGFEAIVPAKIDGDDAFVVSSASDTKVDFGIMRVDGCYQYTATCVDGAWVIISTIAPPTVIDYDYSVDTYGSLYANMGISNSSKQLLTALIDEKQDSLEAAIVDMQTSGASYETTTTIDVTHVFGVGAEVTPSVGDIVSFDITYWADQTVTSVASYTATYTADGWKIAAAADKKDDADKGDSDKGDSDKGDSDKGDSDKGDSDKGDSDKGDSDKGDSDKGDSDSDKKDDNTTFAGMALTNDVTVEKLKDVLKSSYDSAEATMTAWLREQGITASDYSIQIRNSAYANILGVETGSVEFTLKPVKSGKQILGKMIYEDGVWSVALTGTKDADDTTDKSDSDKKTDSNDSGVTKTDANTKSEVAENKASSSNLVSSDATQATPKDKATLQTGVDSFAMPVAIVAIVAAAGAVVVVVRRHQQE